MSEDSSKKTNRQTEYRTDKTNSHSRQHSSISAGSHSRQHSHNGSGRSYGNRRNSRSLKHRIKHFIRHNKLQVFLSSVIIIAVLLVAGLVLFQGIRKNQKIIRSGNSYDMGTGYRNITYNGKKYQYNSLITTILYAGIDSVGKIEKTGYAQAARSDTVSLVVLDKKHKKMTIMAFNRDTMTDIHRYSLTGKDRGTYITHLGYAYTYGDGGKVSCENVKEAVSSMLGGIPINEYVVTNRSSMTYINNLAGGITVQVPNDDLVEIHPELYEGAVVQLDDSNVEDFLRYRDTSIHFTNEGRIQRQQAYVTAFVNQMKKLVRENPEGIWNQVEDMDDYLQTSITKNKYLNLLNTASLVEFSDNDYYRPEGEDKAGENHDEFYIDKEKLREKVIELFYEEI